MLNGFGYGYASHLIFSKAKKLKCLSGATMKRLCSPMHELGVTSAIDSTNYQM